MGVVDNNTAGNGGGPNFGGPSKGGGSGDGSNPYDLGDGTDNNHQEGHAPGLGGWAQALGLSSSFQAQGPDKKAYGGFISGSINNEGTYQQKGDAAENRGAAQINNQFQGQSRGNLGEDRGNLGGLLSSLKGEADGTTQGAGSAQFQRGLDASIAAQQAAANSVRGGATAQAGAQRAAAQQGVQSQAAATSSAAQLSAQEQWQAQQLYGQVANNMSTNDMSQYGLEQSDAEKQASLVEQQNQLNDQYSLGLYGDANTANEQALQALNGYTEGNNAAQKINAQTASNAAGGGNDLFGKIVGAGSSLLGIGAGGGAGAAGSGAGGAGSGADAGAGGADAAGGDAGAAGSGVDAGAGGGGGGGGDAGAVAAAARGGAIHRGQPTLVGEHGPELVLPDRDGFVMTAAQTAALRGAPPTAKQLHDMRPSMVDDFLRHVDPKAYAARQAPGKSGR